MNGRVFDRAIGAIAWVAATAWTVAASAADEIPVEQDITVPALSLRVPKDELVSFAGLRNDDTVAGKPGFMMYAGPLPAALVEVFAHGVIESHKQAQEKRDRNTLSDNVLAPYQTLLSHFSNAELMGRALDGLTTHGEKTLIQFSERAGPGWLIECSPEFFVTQDARALVLQNSIVIHSPDAASPAAFKNVVAVVGRPRDPAPNDPQNAWIVQGGALLASESVDLLRESLILALRELKGGFAGHATAYRTVRFPRGGVEKMERAQILHETPQHVVLRTLRGWIMSVPVPVPVSVPVPASGPAAELPDTTASR
jgi:hypothetical protein